MSQIFLTDFGSRLDLAESPYKTLDEIYRPTGPMGFGQKVVTAADQETLTGQLYRYVSRPDYFANPSFRVTDELRNKYKDRIPEEAMTRIIDSRPVNLTEFLDEVRDVEVTERRRKRMFEGGTGGLLSGLAATLLVSGGEAAAITAGAAAAGTAFAGPVGGVIAGVGTAGSKLRRMRGLLKMAGSALAVDVPMELIRKKLDKSITETDLYFALGASLVAGGALGAAFPGLTEIRRAVDAKATASAAREVADAASKAGREDLAAQLKKQAADAELNISEPMTRVNTISALRDSVQKLKGVALNAERKRLGIPASRAGKRLKVAEIREEIANKRIAERAESEDNEELFGEALAVAQSALNSMAKHSLRKVAKKLEVKVRNSDTPGQLRSRIFKKIKKQLEKDDGSVEAFFSPTQNRFKIGKLGRMDDPETTIDLKITELEEADGVRAIDVNSDDYAIYADDAARRTVAGERDKRGRRGALGFLVEGGVPVLGRTLNRIFTAQSTVLMGMANQVPLLSRVVTLTMQQPRSGGVNAYGAVEIAREQLMGELHRSLLMPRRNFIKQGGTHAEYDIQVVRALTDPDTIVEELSDEIRQGVLAVRRLNNKLLKRLQKANLLGDDYPDPTLFFRRKYKNSRFIAQKDRLMAEGMTEDEATDAITEFFVKSLRSHALREGIEFNESFSRLAAKRIVSFGMDPTAHRNFKSTVRHLQRVKEQIRADAQKINADIDDEMIDDVIKALGYQGTEQRYMLSFQRSRFELDENFSDELGDVSLHIDEFFDRNIDEISSSYTHTALGATEYLKVVRALGFDEGTDVEEIISQSIKGLDEKDAAYARDALEKTFNRLLGIPLYEASRETVKLVVTAQALVQSTFGTLLGLAQLPEIANIMVRPGIAAALQGRLDAGDILKTFFMGVTGERGLRGPDGRLLDKTMAELETHIGCGGDYLRGEHVLRRFDELNDDHTRAVGLIEKGRNASMVMPLGIIPMDTFLRRWATKATFQSFVNQAYDLKAGKPVLNKTFWRNNKERMAELGLNEEQAKRVFDALAKPGVVEVRPGLFGKYKVMDINFEKIDDVHAYDMVVLAVRRSVDNMVQRQSIGELPKWMSGNLVVKLLTQYRVFMMASKGKQVAAGVARGDASEAVNFVGSVGLGLLGYNILTNLRSTAFSGTEREKYLNENLTLDRQVKSGLFRSSYSSYFLALTDTVSTAFGGDAIFGRNARTSGSGSTPTPSSFVTGTAAFSAADRLSRGVFGIARGVAQPDREVTQKNVRDTVFSLPFTNLPGIKQLLDGGINMTGLPQTN